MGYVHTILRDGRDQLKMGLPRAYTVPSDISQSEIDQLISARQANVNGGYYVDDPEYWERGHCQADAPDLPNAAPTLRFERTEGVLNCENAIAV